MIFDGNLVNFDFQSLIITRPSRRPRRALRFHTTTKSPRRPRIINIELLTQHPFQQVSLLLHLFEVFLASKDEWPLENTVFFLESVDLRGDASGKAFDLGDAFL